jgi:hypothetical protein
MKLGSGFFTLTDQITACSADPRVVLGTLSVDTSVGAGRFLRLAAVDPQDAVDELNAGGLNPTQASSFHQVVSPIRTALNATTVPIS